MAKTKNLAVLKQITINRGISVGGGFRFLCIGCQIGSVGLGKGVK